jgi:hypothetical protein
MLSSYHSGAMPFGMGYMLFGVRAAVALRYVSAFSSMSDVRRADRAASVKVVSDVFFVPARFV